MRKLLIVWGFVKAHPHEQAGIELGRARDALMEAEGRREEAVAGVAMFQSRGARLTRQLGADDRRTKDALLKLMEFEGKLEDEDSKCVMLRSRVQRLEQAAFAPVDYNSESLA